MHISNKCSVAVHCLIFINEYGGDNRVTSELLSLSTGCNPVTVRNILSALKKARLIDIKPGTGGATLARPAEAVTLYRICMAVDPTAIDRMIGIHPSPSQLCPVGRTIEPVLRSAYSKVKDSMIKGMDSVTLESMIEDFHKANGI